MFIVLEAINAAGKTTQFNLLQKAFKNAGRSVKSCHFHQRDLPTGQLIEHKFLHQKNLHQKFTRREQALLYIQDFYTRAADITEHLKSKNNVFLADRFYTSTLAYQTIGLTDQPRKKMISWIKWLCEEDAPRLPKPDKIIFLDTPVNISLQHLAKGQPSQKDYFETKQRLQALRRSYLKIAKEDNWIIINCADDRGAQRSIQDIHQDIWRAIS